MTPASNVSISLTETLRQRAQMLAKVRSFFAERKVLEVDTPLLSHYAPIDTHIDLFEVKLDHSETGYLHSSPEYAMKRLLAAGAGDIYQLSHVYRKEELGNLHNPVFTLIEWYRIKQSYAAFTRELIDLIALFLGSQSVEILSYRAAFQRELSLDPFTASLDELSDLAITHQLSSTYKSVDDALNLLWGYFVEPRLGHNQLTLVTDYPASQAALAQTVIRDGIEVAERFEVYWRGIELANGYHELRDAREQQRRLEEANRMRSQYGKAPLPVDPYFLTALKKGLPDCYGVAVGFDRLLMLMLDLPSIKDVLSFSWNCSL
ncbi:MAG: EF-P lysine aminoacylase EpmA [Chlamydiota bacterium]